MTKCNHGEPDRLDAHRAARATPDAGDAPAMRGSASSLDSEPEAPTSFEESPAVVRARRLEELREIVDAGDYRPDPGKIAESMLDNERS